MSPNKKYVKLEIRNPSAAIPRTDVFIWNMETGKQSFKGTYVNNLGVAFSKDNKLLIYNNNTLFRIDPETYLETSEKQILLTKDYFINHPNFESCPYAFYYSDKLDWCIWDLATTTSDGENLNTIVITDLYGNVLYYYDNLKIPFKIFFRKPI